MSDSKYVVTLERISGDACAACSRKSCAGNAAWMWRTHDHVVLVCCQHLTDGAVRIVEKVS